MSTVATVLGQKILDGNAIYIDHYDELITTVLERGGYESIDLACMLNYPREHRITELTYHSSRDQLPEIAPIEYLSQMDVVVSDPKDPIATASYNTTASQLLSAMMAPIAKEISAHLEVLFGKENDSRCKLPATITLSIHKPLSVMVHRIHPHGSIDIVLFYRIEGEFVKRWKTRL